MICKCIATNGTIRPLEPKHNLPALNVDPTHLGVVSRGAACDLEKEEVAQGGGKGGASRGPWMIWMNACCRAAVSYLARGPRYVVASEQEAATECRVEFGRKIQEDLGLFESCMYMAIIGSSSDDCRRGQERKGMLFTQALNGGGGGGIVIMIQLVLQLWVSLQHDELGVEDMLSWR
ncbi:hypothetical protein H4582DRAFT_2067172 [Lactarius indigo]|nr:hypothetical protein H4582DRAFT_2067172 [Lactarius indigo]